MFGNLRLYHTNIFTDNTQHDEWSTFLAGLMFNVSSLLWLDLRICTELDGSTAKATIQHEQPKDSKSNSSKHTPFTWQQSITKLPLKRTFNMRWHKFTVSGGRQKSAQMKKTMNWCDCCDDGAELPNVILYPCGRLVLQQPWNDQQVQIVCCSHFLLFEFTDRYFVPIRIEAWSSKNFINLKHYLNTNWNHFKSKLGFALKRRRKVKKKILENWPRK